MYVSDRAKIASDLKCQKKVVKSRIRRALKEAGSQALRNNDSKLAWKFIKKATFTGKGHSHPELNLTTLNDFFASMVQSIPEPDRNFLSAQYLSNRFAFCSLTVKKVELMLKNIKANTATGPDDLPGSLSPTSGSCYCT